jgi:hypothetical protein
VARNPAGAMFVPKNASFTNNHLNFDQNLSFVLDNDLSNSNMNNSISVLNSPQKNPYLPDDIEHIDLSNSERPANLTNLNKNSARPNLPIFNRNVQQAPHPNLTSAKAP